MPRYQATPAPYPFLVTAGRPIADAGYTSHSTDVVKLGPLPKPAVTALLASIAALPPEPWAEQLPADLWHATAGSPFMILETLQLALRETDILARNKRSVMLDIGDESAQ